MTRPSYDPLRPAAPPFPRHRFEAAGLSADAVGKVAEHYATLDYDGRVAFFRDATRVPNEELSRRYADGEDNGPSPALATPEELANQHKADELRQMAQEAGVPATGTKVEVAARIVQAATGEQPAVTPQQAAAAQGTTAEPASAPESPATPPPAPTPTGPATDGTPAPTAPADGTAATVPPETPAAPAAGTTAPTGGTTP